MRQGRADRDGRAGWKTEPKSKAGNPEGVDQMGQALAFKHRPIFEGKGYSPPGPERAALGPGGGRTIHPSGSQGKHK
jgi:hypothetical protein